MLRLPLIQARPGMVLALPVMHPERSDMVLLRAGFRLSQPEIDKLREMRLAELWIKYPGLDFLGQYISPDVQRERGRVTAMIGHALDRSLGGLDPSLNYIHYKSAVGALVEELMRNRDAQVFLHELNECQVVGMRHASSVCMLSLLMGLRLDFYLERERPRLLPQHARDTTPLGVGALLHDIGMTRLAPEVQERYRQTRDQDDPAWREHVRIGYGMVQGCLDPAAAATVLHHHQRFDGSGWPGARVGRATGLAGSEIHVFARIVQAADVFDRLRHGRGADDPRAGDRPRPAVSALAAMRREPYRKWVDPMVFKGLMAVAPPYSPGTLVKLSTGDTGVVVGWDVRDPCRPEVKLVGDVTEEFERADSRGERVDLRTCREVRIVESDGQPVEEDNFSPGDEAEFDLEVIARRLSNRADEMGQMAKCKG